MPRLNLPNVFTGPLFSAPWRTIGNELVGKQRPSYERAIFLHNDGITLASDVRRFGTVGEGKFGAGNASAGTQKTEVFVATGGSQPVTQQNCLAEAVSAYGSKVTSNRSSLVAGRSVVRDPDFTLSRPRACGPG